jgi:cytochrome c
MPRFKRTKLEGIVKIFVDQETDLMRERYALIYATHRGRKRFQENCVHVKDTEQAALSGANSAAHLHPALVLGPSKSSEGHHMYYLVRWLD